MTSDKKNISLLADIFVKSGLNNIVISPGSRNAPIILAFANRAEINAFSIVDERSAAFFAIGLALSTKKTVAIACTSGSAVLNYASAISEAYYQKIPLLILTADRPVHLIDVGDGQTIRQYKIFDNYVKSSYQLPFEINSKDEIISTEAIINEALLNCKYPQPGPVHINIPFDEPIYNTSDKQITGNFIGNPTRFKTKLIGNISKKWNTSSKVMILAGQMSPDTNLNTIIKKISKHSNNIILSETTSNIYGELVIDTIDNVISTISKVEIDNYKPDILISLGGQVVSKMIKKFLRNNQPKIHWHISSSGEKMDTFFCLTDVIKLKEIDFFGTILPSLEKNNSSYSNIWQKRKKLIDASRREYLLNCEYSDLKVFDSIFNLLPHNCVIHLGNSTPVRYSQLFGIKNDIEYNSNRGVSGIDGQVSTAAGYSYYSEKLNILITGDLGFFYDSNGLMNHHLSSNFKIIVINNSGGGIFRFIPGPDSTPNLEEFFETQHNWKAKYICKAFGVEYTKAESISEVNNILPSFLSSEKGPSLIEIFTPSAKNGEVLRDYFSFIKSAENK